MFAGRRLPLAAVPLLLLLLPAACARDDPVTGLPGVRLGYMQKLARFLASDELAGREVGGAGITRVEEQVARRFAAAGLKPLPGRESFFQEFSLYRTGFPAEGAALSLQAPGLRLRGEAGRDFRPFEFSGSGERSAPVVFAGYGITAPEYGWDDYRGLEVRGSFVLVLRHEPGNADPRSRFAGTANTTHAYFRTKAENALARGAAGLLLVDDPLDSGREEDLSFAASYGLEPPAGTAIPLDPAFLAVHLGRELAGKLLAEAGLELRRLQEAVDAGRRPVSLSMGAVRAAVSLPLPETRRIQARNVVGFLEGRDPALRSEWLLIGAHHDHIGLSGGTGDAIYNGADDNASGVIGVLALARLFGRYGAWPGPGVAARRSLVFATFSAEEQGLWGSQALARELAPETASGRAGSGRLVYMLNLDMIGRNPQKPVQVLSDRPEDLRRLMEAAAAASPALPAPRLSSGRGQMASDHAAFFQRGVPYLFFFTGLHPDYHGVDDEAEWLDYPRLAEVIRLAWRVASLLSGPAPVP